MLNFLSHAFDRFRGGGTAAITVPPMDGVFGPNERLDDASLVVEAQEPDDLVGDGRRVLFSSGRQLFKLQFDEPLLISI